MVPKIQTVEGLNKQQETKETIGFVWLYLKKQYLRVPTHLLDHITYSCKFPALWIGKKSAKIKNWGRNTGDNNKIYVCMNEEEIQQFDEIDGEKMSTF